MTGVRVQHVDHAAGMTIFGQGDAPTSVIYVVTITVQLSVLSHAWKGAVIAVVEAGQFFGESCLAGWPPHPP
jgi:CRP-like cAMP-binding protein